MFVNYQNEGESACSSFSGLRLFNIIDGMVTLQGDYVIKKLVPCLFTEIHNTVFQRACKMSTVEFILRLRLAKIS